VAREWRGILELDRPEVGYIEDALEQSPAKLDFDVDRETLEVYARSESSLRRELKAARRTLAHFNLADQVVGRPRIERWNDELSEYVSLDDSEEREPLHDARVLVRVEVETVFGCRAVREELERLARPVVREENRAVETVAADSDEAAELASVLERLPEVAAVTSHVLGRYRRWRMRQKLFGNYARRAPGAPP